MEQARKAKMWSVRMAHPNSVPSESAPTLEELQNEIRATARDQLHASSELQLARIHEQLSSAWHQDLERILDERLAEAASRIQEWHETESGSKLAGLTANVRANARRDLSEQLGSAVRRLREFVSEEHWSQALLDATRGFCDRAALFIVNGPRLD